MLERRKERESMGLSKYMRRAVGYEKRQMRSKTTLQLDLDLISIMVNEP